MRAVICSKYGPPEQLVVGDMDSPALGENGIRVRVHAASVNFPDTLIIEGKYQLQPPFPFVPGFEVAGEVVEIAPSVRKFAVGDRVMALTSAGYGGFAEEAITDEESTELVPDGMDYPTATAFYSSYATSYHGLVQRGRLKTGETLLVLGAAGGVGLATIEIGKALGARVIAAAGSDEKRSVASDHGADEVVDYTRGDFREQLRELTCGKGIDVCLDGVGGDAFDHVSRAMNYGGRLLVVGFASGTIPKLPVNLLLLKGYSAVGVYWNTFVRREPELKSANADALARLFTTGQLRPLVAETFGIEDIVAALTAVTKRGTAGKLVVTM
ncbi:Quinone oxidoreductase [Rhodococcus wratislaviensis]|uniref:Quinone oxidoreductase n=2 Tax=Rhodococcus wratislaviensis TaxID=44752 RepID=A0A402CC03_RHOWR|nr:Quinone oxidoreductase [Rhodococcus wratislaviensis]